MRISKELDIKNLIQSMRINRNSMKLLTTLAERRFVKMQADKNVLVLREGERSLLEINTDDLS
jgi:hypothetical protein